MGMGLWMLGFDVGNAKQLSNAKIPLLALPWTNRAVKGCLVNAVQLTLPSISRHLTQPSNGSSSIGRINNGNCNTSEDVFDYPDLVQFGRVHIA